MWILLLLVLLPILIKIITTICYKLLKVSIYLIIKHIFFKEKIEQINHLHIVLPKMCIFTF